MPKPQVLIIGIDGGTFNLIDPYIRLGYLPNIASLMADGARGELRSTLTPNTCPAWKSFSTGRNPGRLGVFDWQNKEYGSYDVHLAEPQNIPGRDLWDILGEAGKRVAVVGVPMTYPPREVNGVMLTGMLTPLDAEFAYPEEVGREIEKQVGPWLHDPAVLTEPDEDDLYEEQNEITIYRTHVMRHLLQEQEFDFAMVVFTATDRLQHLF
jgi:predicted AlkP superfamily phosphohydrolase/phosphomutase